MAVKMDKDKPGVMLYFELMPMFDELSNTAVAELVLAIMNYARDGVLPEFEDPALRAVWPLMQRHVELDDEVYRRKSEARRKAALKRWGKDQEDANASLALQNMPTTNTATNTSTSTYPTTTTNTNTKSFSVSKRNQEKDAWMWDYIR